MDPSAPPSACPAPSTRWRAQRTRCAPSDSLPHLSATRAAFTSAQAARPHGSARGDRPPHPLLVLRRSSLRDRRCVPDRWRKIVHVTVVACDRCVTHVRYVRNLVHRSRLPSSSRLSLEARDVQCARLSWSEKSPDFLGDPDEVVGDGLGSRWREGGATRTECRASRTEC